MRTFILATLLAAPCLAQQTVVETRVFDSEVFSDLSPYGFDTYIGLQSGTIPADGQVVFVDIDIQVEWDFELLLTNNLTQPTGFGFFTPVGMTSSPCDCSEYGIDSIGSFTGQIPPGASALLDVDHTSNFSFSDSSFNIAGGQGVWPWMSLYLWSSIIDGYERLCYGGGFPVPDSWLQTLVAQATVTGHMTVEWIPNELPHQNVCDGNSVTPTTLTPAGDFDRLWLLQTGVPQDFNLLIQSPTATSVLPSHGLCIAGGGGYFSRINESLGIGGTPFKFLHDPALSGTVHYFQAWFRTGVGGAQTGECIGVSFP